MHYLELVHTRLPYNNNNKFGTFFHGLYGHNSPNFHAHKYSHKLFATQEYVNNLIGSSNVTIETGNSSNVTTWVSLDLGLSSQFQNRCEYRFRVDATIGVATPGTWYYASAVGENSIVYIAHNGAVSHIDATSKNTYRVNGAAVYTILEIEESCGSSEELSVGLYQDWPDILECNANNGDVWYYELANHGAATAGVDIVGYHHKGWDRRYIFFTKSDGNYHSEVRGSSDCASKSISELESLGKTKTYVYE